MQGYTHVQKIQKKLDMTGFGVYAENTGRDGGILTQIGRKTDMELSIFFKSVLDQDRAAIVLCDLNHTILYMNPAAVRKYAKWGGEKLIGQNLLACHNPHSQEMIYKTLDWFEKSADHNIIYEFHNEKENRDAYMVALRDEEGKLIGYYEKHEYRDPETESVYTFH